MFRALHLLLVAAVALAASEAAAQQKFVAKPLDWEAFVNPDAIVLTDQFAGAIAALPKEGQAKELARLREFLQHKEIEVRRQAALTLGKLGDNSGASVMIEIFPQTTGRDRDNVVVALRILKDPKSIPLLRETLKDPSPYVRCIAVAALGEMKAAEAYPQIVALTTDKGLQQGCLPMAPGHLACYALGALGDKKAVPVLIERLRDKDFENQAQQALEKLTGEKLGNDPDRWTHWWKMQNR